VHVILLSSAHLQNMNSDDFKSLFGFLSKEYWLDQNEYTPGLDELYGKIQNHASVFTVEPKGLLMIYDDEWQNHENVDATLDELDEDNHRDTVYICNWLDDSGLTFYTMLAKDDDDNIVCVTRLTPIDNIALTPDKLVEMRWTPIKVLYNTQNQIIWESPKQNACTFLEMYKDWVRRFDANSESNSTCDELE